MLLPLAQSGVTVLLQGGMEESCLYGARVIPRNHLLAQQQALLS